MSNYESIHARQCAPFGADHVLLGDLDFEVVVVLPGEDLETGLVFLVGDAEQDSGAKHELRAFQKVEHNVFQLWLHCLLVNEVEVHLLLGNDLYPHISFDVVDLSSDLGQFSVFGPFAKVCGVLVFVYLEEEDGVT